MSSGESDDEIKVIAPKYSKQFEMLQNIMDNKYYCEIDDGGIEISGLKEIKIIKHIYQLKNHDQTDKTKVSDDETDSGFYRR